MGSVQELRDDQEVPASLLPELERLWQEGRAAAAAGGAGPSNPPAPLNWMMMEMFNPHDEEYYDENEEYCDGYDCCCC